MQPLHFWCNLLRNSLFKNTDTTQLIFIYREWRLGLYFSFEMALGESEIERQAKFIKMWRRRRTLEMFWLMRAAAINYCSYSRAKPTRSVICHETPSTNVSLAAIIRYLSLIDNSANLSQLLHESWHRVYSYIHHTLWQHLIWRSQKDFSSFITNYKLLFCFIWLS